MNKDIDAAKGDGIKQRSSLEDAEVYQKAWRNIIAKCDIQAAKVITNGMIIIKRLGYGIAPKFLNVVIGRVARMEIKEDEWITWEMV